LLLGVAAGLALRGVWAGTTPLLVVAGVALYVAGLDAVEPLAQEIDHPTRSRSVPIERGEVYVRHLPVGTVVMAVVAVVGAAAALLVDPSLGGLAVAAICVVPAALGSVAGAVTSVLSGMPEVSTGDAWSLMPPEVAGVRIMVRAVWPPALAVLGTLPVLAARAAAENGRAAASSAGAAAVAVVVVFMLVGSWVRMRDRMHAWWKAAMDQAFPDGKPREPEGAAHAA
jgi:hypothetical protein